MKVFSKNNSEFKCLNCNKQVQKHPNSSRDHCNFCLYGLHVDINPGDRLNECRGILEPIGLKISNGKTQIVYKCQKCEKRAYCIKAEDDLNLEIARISKLIWNS